VRPGDVRNEIRPNSHAAQLSKRATKA
jgi:hypothetical protein